ncbi:MAG: chorismate mutase, partial [Peptococcaceae bacterium]|nr:chorismate mutase [Peptococcaceae bacterium]
MAGINEKTNENGLEDYYKSHNELTPNELNLTHNELDKLRGEIDQIDRQLLKLFEARMDTAAKVARYKEANNLAITDKAREQKVLDQIALWARPEYKEQVRILFQTIMDLSKQVQARHMTRTAGIVGYQGMPGSFSEQAVLEYFGDGPLERKNYASFEDVCKALQAKDIDYGVLPLENSLTGGITEVYDLLSAYGFYIVGEKIVKIDHNLLVNPGTRLESVREVISHPQAFLQCSNFLKRHPEWKLISCSNTAVSAKMLAERANNHQAVIAGKRAAELYGLQVLAEGIH